MSRATGFFTAATVVSLLTAGCSVGPDFHRPLAPEVNRYTAQPLPATTTGTDTAGGQPQTFNGGADIPGEWWALFHSQAMNRLMERALRANPSLQAAQAALREAQENVYATRGELFPSVNATGSAEREKNTGAEFGNPNSPGSTFSLYNASVDVSYGFDIFGLARRTIESVQAQEEFQRYQLEAAYLTLTANVATAAVQEASLRAQIAATDEVIKIEADQLNVLQDQFNAGAIARAIVLAQQATLAQSRATLPSLEKQLAQTRHQLTALAGGFPGQGEDESFDLNALQLPQELPVSLPSRLVEQRPDIRAAEAQLHQASAQVGIATANLLPLVTISASLGSASTSISDLFSSGTMIWNLGANLTQPLFHGGTLTHQRRAAVDAYDQAAAQYRSTVISAFQNVADVLRALQSDADALQSQVQAAQAASQSLEISQQQYQVGAISYLTLLNAQQTYQQTQLALIQARASRYADTAALFQALGGGWWHRDDTAASTAQPGPNDGGTPAR